MSHPYEAREAARREISRLVALARTRIEQIEREAKDEARAICFERARTRNPYFGMRCAYKIGASGETVEMRKLYEELRAQGLGRLEPELAALRRKIQRTVRYFGFNDVEVRF